MKNLAEKSLNITGILKKFKSLIKKVYQNGCTHKGNKKKNQNNYYRGERTQGKENYLLIKSRLTFKFTRNLLLLKEKIFFKSKFANACMCYEKLQTIFHDNTVVTKTYWALKEKNIKIITFVFFSFLLLSNIRGTNCKCFQNNIRKILEKY